MMDKLNFFESIFLNLDGNIEIREIDPKDKTVKRHFFSTLKGVQDYNPPSDKNVYFGVYTRKNKRGVANECITTNTIWADFDYQSKEQVKYIIDNSGLPPASILINSGKGIHAYWILKTRAGNEAVHILKAIAYRTGADTKSAEKARILRVPGSFNLKRDIPVKTTIVDFNNNRYELGTFKKILQTELERIEKLGSDKLGLEELNNLKNNSRACIRMMAKGTLEGHRNFALCKVTKYLQVKGYTRRDALSVIRRWNTLNSPPKQDNQLLTGFNKVWDTDYRFLGCNFKDELLQKQSDYFCSMGECKYATIQKIDVASDSSNKIDNRIFDNDIYKDVKGMELAIFFTVAKTEGITRNHLAEVIGIYKKNENFIKSIAHLKDLKFIKIIEGNKRVKERDILINGSEFTNGRGYTVINNLLSEAFLGRRINDTEYKLLVLLKSYSFSESSVHPTRETLAIKMGTTTKTITNTLNSLEYKIYVKKSYLKLEKGGTKLNIKLLF